MGTARGNVNGRIVQTIPTSTHIDDVEVLSPRPRGPLEAQARRGSAGRVRRGHAAARVAEPVVRPVPVHDHVLQDIASSVLVAVVGRRQGLQVEHAIEELHFVHAAEQVQLRQNQPVDDVPCA